MGRLKGDYIGSDFVEGRQVARLPGSNVGSIDTPVLIAVLVLGVEDILRIVLPEQVSDAALAIVGDGAIVRLAQSAYPNVEHSLVGGKIGEHGAVGRNLWRRALRIAEQHAARNQLRLGVGECNQGKQKANSKAGGRETAHH